MSAYIDGDQTPLPGDAQASSDGRLHAASASTEPLRLHFESEHAATEACARLARFSIRCRRASLHSVLIETDAENCLHVLHHLEMAAAERARYSPGGDAKESVATQPGGTPIKSRPRVRALSPRSKQIWLARMLNEERLTCLFQPIVHCDETREVYGFESLMRGREDGALIAASQLLEVAREAGLVAQLEAAARHESFVQAGCYRIAHKIFINATPSTLLSSYFDPRQLAPHVTKQGLRANQVVIEITEGEHVTDFRGLRAAVESLRADGFHIALDDVGSGYSSLRMLDALRPDYVKLDRALVQDVHLDEYRARLSRCILDAARSLGVRTILEGIECEGEYQWAMQNGADFAQGFHLGRPVPAASALAR